MPGRYVPRAQFTAQGRMRRTPKPLSGELLLHIQICDYLRLQHRGVIFMSDYSAGIRLTLAQASKRKRMNYKRGMPDLYILRARQGYHGLALELKNEGVSVYLKDGETVRADKHFLEQAAFHDELRSEGWRVEFVCGFEAAKHVIDDYLGLDGRRFEGF